MSPIKVTGFEVGEEVGRGGFGVVYRARQVDLNRPSALKVLHSHGLSEDSRRRFARECRVIGSLRPHPSIVSVYQTGETDHGAPFLAMEYLPGGTLSKRIPLPPGDVRRIGVQLADALAVAHAGGVVHRDVKPSNVLFAENGTPVLVDFGIASFVGENSTATSSVAMSLGYAPPEVLDGERVDVPADVYGLGATIFAALTGTAPFSGSGDSSIAVIAIRIATRPVDDLRPHGVPDGLCRVIETAMAKDPAVRYASMTEMRDALLAVDVGDDADVVTMRVSDVPSVASVAGRSRRRRGLVAAAAVVALLGSGATAWAIGAPRAARHVSAAQKSASVSAAARSSAAASGSASARAAESSAAKRSAARSRGAAGTSTVVVFPGPVGGRAQVSAGGGGVQSVPVVGGIPARNGTTTAKVVVPPPPPPPAAQPSSYPTPRLAGGSHCTISGAAVNTDVSIPANCPTWRGDWYPTVQATYYPCFVQVGFTSTTPSASTGSIPSCGGTTWTVSSTKPATCTFSYRLQLRYGAAETPGAFSAQTDYVTVTFT